MTPPTKKSCAQCCELVFESELQPEPWGRNDAMVRVCRSCREDVIEVKGPRLEGFQPSGGFLSDKELTQKLKEKMGEEKYLSEIARDEAFGRAPARVKISEGDRATIEFDLENRRRIRGGTVFGKAKVIRNAEAQRRKVKR